MKNYLTKKDFTRWTNCPTAAYHGWHGLKSNTEDDAFLKFLAKEGETVGRMAHRLFLNGESLSDKNPHAANEETRRRIAQSDCTLFEACIINGSYLARPDVLIVRDKTVYLIEVKSKVGNSEQHKAGKLLVNYYGDVRAAYKEIVHDLAFQTVLLERAFPVYTVVPYLLLPDECTESKEAEVSAARNEEQVVDLPATDAEVQANRSGSVLKFFSAGKAIKLIRQTVSSQMDAMAAAWRSGERPKPQLKYGCKNCEFRLGNGRVADDGYHKCWGSLAQPDPHLFDLYQLYALKTGEKNQGLLADEKIQSGETSLYDIIEEELHGEHSERQRMQLTFGRSGEEWIDPRLGEEIENLKWPIAFLDFETVMAAIPWYKGLRPYQVLPFQFSCHILRADGSMTHREWLNTEDRIPIRPFVEALKSALEGVETVLVYTSYEQRILKESLEYLSKFGSETSDLRSWLFDLLFSADKIIDQHEWVYRYFYPANTKLGRTSIKVILDAVWQSNPSLHRHSYFRRYYREDDGQILDPYKTLPDNNIAGLPFSVREGCGAMRAYREMIVGSGASSPETKSKLAAMLRAYVTLDTASQWIIFHHWQRHFNVVATTETRVPIDAS
ncbi:MAG: DUF2779 domain-containing protein [Opitutales bacterium]